MSFEDEIKQKHEAEKGLRTFLSFISAMTREEIEIAIARISDNLAKTIGDDAYSVFMQKLLIRCLHLRANNRLKQNIIKRASLELQKRSHCKKIGESRYQKACLVWEKERQQRELVNQKEWTRYTIAIEERNEKIRSMPIFKRLFSKLPDLPGVKLLLPIPAPVRSGYIKEVKKTLTMSEFLISVLAGNSDADTDIPNATRTKNFSDDTIVLLSN